MQFEMVPYGFYGGSNDCPPLRYTSSRVNMSPASHPVVNKTARVSRQERKSRVYNYENNSPMFVGFGNFWSNFKYKLSAPFRHWRESYAFYEECVTELDNTDVYVSVVDEAPEAGSHEDSEPKALESAGGSGAQLATSAEAARPAVSSTAMLPSPLPNLPNFQIVKSKETKTSPLPGKFVMDVACQVKVRFGGTPEYTQANIAAVKEYACRVMYAHGMRWAHIYRDLPKVVALVFTPSRDEIKTAYMMQKSGIVRRNKDYYAYQPGRC